MQYRYNIFITCDPVYHQQWARELARSVLYHNPWIRVVILVINPDDTLEPLPGVHYEYRHQELTDHDRVMYYQAARFIWADEIFQEQDLVMCLDADTVCTRAFTRSQFWRITRRAHALWHNKQRNWLAGLVTLGLDPAFRRAFRDALLSTPRQQWEYGHDQLVLRELIPKFDVRAVRNTGHWISIGKGPGTFLTLKGEQKNPGRRLTLFQSKLVQDISIEPPPDLPLVRATALVGPWLQELPLPRFSTVDMRALDQIDPDNLPDVWIIHNNTSNKRTKRFRQHYALIKDSGLPFVVVESPAFRHNQAQPDQDGVYYRWSWFSYFQDQGIHHQPDSPPDRWQQIQQEQNIEIHPWQHRGDNILFLLQRPGDSSMLPMIQRWGSYENMVMQTISRIRQVTDRPIRLRLHPLRQNQQLDWLEPIMRYHADVKVSRHTVATSNTWVSGGDSLYRDFDEAWCVVGGNSNGLTESACYGLPTWCIDASAMAWPVSQRDWRRIENPRLDIDRQQWLNNLGYCQWRRDEILRGDPWVHLLQWWPQVQELRKELPTWNIVSKI
jgi:hypothetical protein